MNVRAQLASARREAIQRGKLPVEFVLNSAAWSSFVREVEGVADSREWGGIPVSIKSNNQRLPSVILKCHGDLIEAKK